MRWLKKNNNKNLKFWFFLNQIETILFQVWWYKVVNIEAFCEIFLYKMFIVSLETKI
jgi:hypothetical protein